MTIRIKVNNSWHLEIGDPTAEGWSSVAVYMITAALCVRAAWHSRAAPVNESESTARWWLFAVALFFLGVNKQLDLQTLLIELGRRLALREGCYKEWRLMRALLTVIVWLTTICGSVLLFSKHRRFFGENPPAAIGLAIIILFVLIRASTINHADQLFGKIWDEEWGWVLEITGSASITASAVLEERCCYKKSF